MEAYVGYIYSLKTLVLLTKTDLAIIQYINKEYTFGPLTRSLLTVLVPHFDL